MLSGIDYKHTKPMSLEHIEAYKSIVKEKLFLLYYKDIKLVNENNLLILPERITLQLNINK